MPAGTRITAARGGRVVLVVDRFSRGGTDPEHLGLENRIWILHDDGTIGIYAHLLIYSARVAPGQRVEVG